MLLEICTGLAEASRYITFQYPPLSGPMRESRPVDFNLAMLLRMFLELIPNSPWMNVWINFYEIRFFDFRLIALLISLITSGETFQ